MIVNTTGRCDPQVQKALDTAFRQEIRSRGAVAAAIGTSSCKNLRRQRVLVSWHHPCINGSSKCHFSVTSAQQAIGGVSQPNMFSCLIPPTRCAASVAGQQPCNVFKGSAG